MEFVSFRLYSFRQMSSLVHLLCAEADESAIVSDIGELA